MHALRPYLSSADRNWRRRPKPGAPLFYHLKAKEPIGMLLTSLPYPVEPGWTTLGDSDSLPQPGKQTTPPRSWSWQVQVMLSFCPDGESLDARPLHRPPVSPTSLRQHKSDPEDLLASKAHSETEERKQTTRTWEGKERLRLGSQPSCLLADSQGCQHWQNQELAVPRRKLYIS